jgi:hypothetical protein
MFEKAFHNQYEPRHQRIKKEAVSKDIDCPGTRLPTDRDDKTVSIQLLFSSRQSISFETASGIQTCHQSKG